MLRPTVVVAHPDRQDLVQTLAEASKPEAVFWDDDGWGCDVNHHRALRWLTESLTADCDFGIVLEDDAMPVVGFRDQVSRILAVAPTDIVSFYLGTGYPAQWQQTLMTAVAGPITGPDACFLTAPAMLNCVAYAVRATLLDELLDHVVKIRRRHGVKVPIDAAITKFCVKHKIEVGYTRPSIVDHRPNTPSLIHERADHQDRSTKRQAWRFGTRQRWEASMRAIPPPELVRVDPDGSQWYQQQGRRIYE